MEIKCEMQMQTSIIKNFFLVAMLKKREVNFNNICIQLNISKDYFNTYSIQKNHGNISRSFHTSSLKSDVYFT